MGTSSGSEDVAKQKPESLLVYLRMRVIGSDQLCTALDSRPLPTGSYNHRDRGVGTQMSQLAGAAGGYERDRGSTCHRMSKDPGVDDTGVWSAVGAEGDDDTETVVKRHQPRERC
jgi:hypothetical protein